MANGALFIALLIVRRSGDFLLAARRDLDAAKRFFRKAMKDMPLLSPGKIGTDGAGVYPTAIKKSAEEGLVSASVFRRVSKYLQQVIESDHFRIKQMMPKVAGFEEMLLLRKGFGFAGDWTVRRQNKLLALCIGLQKVNEV